MSAYYTTVVATGSQQKKNYFINSSFNIKYTDPQIVDEPLFNLNELDFTPLPSGIWGYPYQTNWYAFAGTNGIFNIDSDNQFTLTSTENTSLYFGQRLPKEFIKDLFGKEVTISIKLKCDVELYVDWKAFEADTSDNFGTVNSATSTQFASGTWLIDSTLNTYTATFTIPNNNRHFEFRIVAPIESDNIITIKEPQLEEGAASAFKPKDYLQDLQDCQQFFYRLGGEQTVEIPIGQDVKVFKNFPQMYNRYPKTPKVITKVNLNSNGALQTDDTVTANSVNYAFNSTSTSTDYISIVWGGVCCYLE